MYDRTIGIDRFVPHFSLHKRFIIYSMILVFKTFNANFCLLRVYISFTFLFNIREKLNVTLFILCVYILYV